MQHDLQLRAAARAIYDACCPSEEWAPVGFDDAERFKTTRFRSAVSAALLVTSVPPWRTVSVPRCGEQVMSKFAGDAKP